MRRLVEAEFSIDRVLEKVGMGDCRMGTGQYPVRGRRVAHGGWRRRPAWRGGEWGWENVGRDWRLRWECVGGFRVRGWHGDP